MLVSPKTVMAAAAAGTGAKTVSDAVGETGIVSVQTTATVGTFPGKGGSTVMLTFAEAPGTSKSAYYIWTGDQLDVTMDADNGAAMDVAYHIMTAE